MLRTEKNALGVNFTVSVGIACAYSVEYYVDACGH